MPAIPLQQLNHHLAKSPLRPICLVASDTILLRQEARDILRKAAGQQGMEARETYQVEQGFDWSGFFAAMQNGNLFSKKMFVELCYPAAKFDAKLLPKILRYLENPASDKVLLLITDKLTASQQKTRWYKAVEKNGLIVQIPVVTPAMLPGWIAERARVAGLRLLPEGISLLAELTTGNLLATQQALQKLGLLYPNDSIGSQEILNVVSDSANFNVFDLTNLMLGGNAQRALRTLRGLMDSDTEPTLILWAITRELRQLQQLVLQHQQGTPFAVLLQKQWQSRRPLLQAALRRLTGDLLNGLLLDAETADHVIKGIQPGKPRVIFERMIVKFCGKSHGYA